jgi:hypothetical protein
MTMEIINIDKKNIYIICGTLSYFMTFHNKGQKTDKGNEIASLRYVKGDIWNPVHNNWRE